MLSRKIGGFISLLCLLPIIIVLGCGGGDSTESTFTTSLRLKDAGGQDNTSFHVGETITFVVSIKNNTSSVQDLIFPNPMYFDVIVFERGTKSIIWRWSADHSVVIDVLGGLLFYPQETKIFTAEWDQKDSNKIQVSSGEYEAQGIMFLDNVYSLNLTPNQFRFELVRFNIF